jgi:hypothetical protein
LSQSPPRLHQQPWPSNPHLKHPLKINQPIKNGSVANARGVHTWSPISANVHARHRATTCASIKSATTARKTTISLPQFRRLLALQPAQALHLFDTDDALQQLSSTKVGSLSTKSDIIQPLCSAHHPLPGQAREWYRLSGGVTTVTISTTLHSVPDVLVANTQSVHIALL